MSITASEGAAIDGGFETLTAGGFLYLISSSFTRALSSLPSCPRSPPVRNPPPLKTPPVLSDLAQKYSVIVVPDSAAFVSTYQTFDFFFLL